MIQNEKLANGYLFLRYPTHYLLILIPIFIGTFQFLFFDTLTIVTNPNSAFLKQNEFIENYLVFMKMSFVILLSFFLSYRWANVINDGSYAYWITQGVDRLKLVFLNLTTFVFTLIFAEFMGLLLIMIIGGLFYSPITMIYLGLLIISNVIFLVVLAYAIGIHIDSPEIAALIYIIINTSILILGVNLSLGFVDVLQSDLQFNKSNPMLQFFSSLILSTSIFLISLRSKINKDLEL